MKIYIALCEDRHIDIVVKVYTTPDKAIAYAKAFVEENARFPDEIDESEIPGWLYSATYSGQGDGVRVEEGTLE